MPRAAPAGAHPAARLNFFVARGVGRTEEKMAHYQNAAWIAVCWRIGRAGRNLLPESGRPEFATASIPVLWMMEGVAGRQGAKSLPMASCGMRAAVNIRGEPRAMNSKY